MNAVARILAAAPHVLLDFDGPVCTVFGGQTSDHAVADLLRLVLGQRADELPPTVLHSADPFEVLRFGGLLGPNGLDTVEARLTVAERRAVSTAPATPGAVDTIIELHRVSRSITVVSNNSAAAVADYLHQHDLMRFIDGIAARTSSDPDLLKPSPHLLHQAIRDRATSPEFCVLIGDSVTDVDAAQSAGALSIGYANKPGKYDRLAGAGATAIVTDMTEIARAARALPQRVQQ